MKQEILHLLSFYFHLCYEILNTHALRKNRKLQEIYIYVLDFCILANSQSIESTA